jgi:hypothetical protein
MSEKVVHEIRVIETEDGFRIEMKGDKEQLRQMLGMFFGRRHGHDRWRGFGGRGPWLERHFGAWGHGRGSDPRKRKYDMGPWWDQEVTEEGQPGEA